MEYLILFVFLDRVNGLAGIPFKCSSMYASNSTTEDSRWLVQTFQVVATANFLNTALDIVTEKGGIMRNNTKVMEIYLLK